LIRAVSIEPASNAERRASDVVALDFDNRHRRRTAMTTEGGMEFLLDLPEVPSLKDGDNLTLEDGRLIAVRAAPERLLEITCTDAHHLARVSWHLGNRHLATEIDEKKLLIRYDHVIADMVRGLGASAREIEAPFNPEGGAYSGHGHDHGHGHAHE
jgi:urease accessory protein